VYIQKSLLRTSGVRAAPLLGCGFFISNEFTMCNEKIKRIPKHPDYGVDREGNVYSFNYRRTGKTKKLKASVNTRGYYYVSIQKDKRGKHKTVHRLVAETFIPNPVNKPQVNHINGIKTDNRVENLEWATSVENLRHAYDTGLKKFPNNTKYLTPEQVREIRDFIEVNKNLPRKERFKIKQIAQYFGVTGTQVCRISRNLSYTHIV
jgi:hypothetical protein